MATLGGYDPNDYLEVFDAGQNAELEELYDAAVKYPEGSEERQTAFNTYNSAVAAARLKQWRNRCVSDGYEPGSTFKLITLAAALDSGAVTLNDTFYCGGAEKIEGRSQVLNCWRHSGHGTETTAQTLQNSCNIAFAHIGLQMGGDTLYDYCRAFGLMETSGIDLPGEASGLFHSRERLSNYAAYGTSYLTSTAFGQSIKPTPIQLVRAVAAIVNGGYLLEPYVVSEVLDEDGNIIEQNSRTVVRQVISEETSAIMCDLMESVVTVGTAKNAKVVGYRVGGKTGTAFGQSIKPTPIQLVRAVAAIVNGGYLLEPYVVSEVLDEDGNIIEQNSRTVVRQVISEETSAIMCDLMESVVTVGTAKNAKVVGYRVGGKTGTAEKLDQRNENGEETDDKITSFIGVAPMDDPKYVILVALDTPNPTTGQYISGGVMGAPTVAAVFEDILPYLGVEPDYSSEDMYRVNISMPSLKGMTESEAANVLSENYLEYRIIGDGNQIVSQIPAAGKMVPGHSTVLLYTDESMPTDKVQVPDLMGMTVSQTTQTLSDLGLYLQAKGTDKEAWHVVVTSQDIDAGTEVDRGTTITVIFADTTDMD